LFAVSSFALKDARRTRIVGMLAEGDEGSQKGIRIAVILGLAGSSGTGGRSGERFA